MKLPKIVTQKTFGIPNWVIGAVGLGVAYVSMNGFPTLNSSGLTQDPCDAEISPSAYDPARIRAGCPGECLKQDCHGRKICGGC